MKRATSCMAVRYLQNNGHKTDTIKACAGRKHDAATSAQEPKSRIKRNAIGERRLPIHNKREKVR